MSTKYYKTALIKGSGNHVPMFFYAIKDDDSEKSLMIFASDYSLMSIHDGKSSIEHDKKQDKFRVSEITKSQFKRVFNHAVKNLIQ